MARLQFRRGEDGCPLGPWVYPHEVDSTWEKPCKVLGKPKLFSGEWFKRLFNL